MRYRVDVGAGARPYRSTRSCCYQPIGYRWAHNLEQYDAPEPKRFVGYYNAMSAQASVMVAKASATTP